MKKEFLQEIERFMKAQNMSRTTFGKLAMNDGNFVFQLMLDGRDVKTSTIERVRKFMRDYNKVRV